MGKDILVTRKNKRWSWTSHTMGKNDNTIKVPTKILWAIYVRKKVSCRDTYEVLNFSDYLEKTDSKIYTIYIGCS